MWAFPVAVPATAAGQVLIAAALPGEMEEVQGKFLG